MTMARKMTLKTLEHEPAEFFGGCPECGECEMLDLGNTEAFACSTHMLYWHLGASCTSRCRGDDVETWERNWALLRTYRKVEPRLFRTAREERQHAWEETLRRYGAYECERTPGDKVDGTSVRDLAHGDIPF